MNESIALLLAEWSQIKRGSTVRVLLHLASLSMADESGWTPALTRGQIMAVVGVSRSESSEVFSAIDRYFSSGVKVGARRAYQLRAIGQGDRYPITTRKNDRISIKKTTFATAPYLIDIRSKEGNIRSNIDHLIEYRSKNGYVCMYDQIHHRDQESNIHTGTPTPLTADEQARRDRLLLRAGIVTDSPTEADRRHAASRALLDFGLWRNAAKSSAESADVLYIEAMADYAEYMRDTGRLVNGRPVQPAWLMSQIKAGAGPANGYYIGWQDSDDQTADEIETVRPAVPVTPGEPPLWWSDSLQIKIGNWSVSDIVRIAKNQIELTWAPSAYQLWIAPYRPLYYDRESREIVLGAEVAAGPDQYRDAFREVVEQVTGGAASCRFVINRELLHEGIK
jgi:hypothetical protein